MADFVKTLLRQPYDEAYVYYKRIDGHWTVVHYFGIVHKAGTNKKHWSVYNKRRVGEITKTKILEWLRRKTT